VKKAGKGRILLLAVCVLAGCSPATIRRVEIETPAPPPPSPTPIYVPSKRLDTARLFNGIQIHSEVVTQKGETATVERQTPSSYVLNLEVKVNVPKPSTDLRQLQALNDQLPALLPGLEEMLATPKVSHFYDDFYRVKVESLQQNLVRLDQLLSRHHFYDCETILELEHPKTKRRALLIQAGMDVDTDGSDGDRIPDVDASSSTFQPTTSYHWAKKTSIPNPFLPAFEARLAQAEMDTATAERPQDLRAALLDLRAAVNQLKKRSFLVASVDPYIVLPGFMLSPAGSPFTPKLGDFCVVIYKNAFYPAIFGDVGPNDKLGEASLRLSRELDSRANANFRPVGELKVSYLVFPGSALTPAGPPELDKWSERCAALLNEIGGYKGELHAWADLTKPSPSPSPLPSPSATPGESPAVSPAPSITPAETAMPSAGTSPEPSRPKPSP